MDQTSLIKRRMIAASGLLVVWGAIFARLVYLQQMQRDSFADSASRQQVSFETLVPRPGEILDRKGRVLATSVVTQSLWVNPRNLHDRTDDIRQLAESLGTDPAALSTRLSENRRKQFLWLQRRLPDELADRVRDLKLPADVVGFREEYQRHYPQGPIAGHLIGLRDIDGDGRGGIEQTYNKTLRGEPGRRQLLCDSRGRVLRVFDESVKQPVDGKPVRLSLDVVLQLDTERELDSLMEQWRPKSAGIIAMDPKTGEVLAFASRPSFDPNAPQDVDDESAWKNILTASMFEPGSTFKPFVVAWALQKGLIQRDEQFHCGNGQYRMGKRTLHDHHPYGNLSVKDILVKSSNVGMAKIGERLTNAGLFEAATRFGFGRKTGSGLPGELEGLLRPLNKWTDYSTGSIPMGQELAVTPLQLITAHAALANGGQLISPRFVLPPLDDALKTGSPGETIPRVVSRTVDADIARWVVRDAMADVVQRGTGKQAKLTDYEVFGKTGTAQKTDPKTGKYMPNRYVCSFIGGAPANDPRMLVLVVVNEPTAKGVHYGGTVAAPTAARVLQIALRQQQVPDRIAAGKSQR